MVTAEKMCAGECFEPSYRVTTGLIVVWAERNGNGGARKAPLDVLRKRLTLDSRP